MARQHLDEKLLDSVFGRQVGPDRFLPIVLGHLLDLCSTCERAFNSWREAALAPASTSLDEALDRATEFARVAEDQVRQEKSTSETLLKSLLALPAGERIDHVKSTPEGFRGPILAELLIEKSHALVANCPRAAVGLAQLAKAVLQHSDPSTVVIELYARAMGHTANALRVFGTLAEAGEMFDDARFLLKSNEGGDRMLFAELDRFQGLLKKAQRQFAEAESLLNRSVIASTLSGAQRERAIAELNLGLLYRETGELQKALQATRKVLTLIDPRDDDQLARYARHNLALVLVDLGRYEEAQQLVAENRAASRFDEEPIFSLRVSWLEALIALGVEDFDSAEPLLCYARQGFARERLSYDEALVALDLTHLYLMRGDTGAVKNLALELAALFEGDAIYREAFAAMLLFRDAAKLEQVTAALIRQLSRYLGRVRQDPSYAFGTAS